MNSKAILGVALIWSATLALGQSVPPRIFFTDITSGPNTGGENGNGAFVTIYGDNFGSAQGSSTVTVGGGAVASVRIWGSSYLWYQKIVVQLGSSALSGNIVVTTAAGTSNGVPFTVRSGKIYFVATGGSDSAAGSFTAPWATIPKCKNTIAQGDICYVRDGVNQTSVDNGYGAITLGTTGTASMPLALLTYPGAKSTIGSNNTQRGLMSCSNLSGCSNGTYWVVGGFNLVGQTWAADLQTSNMRLVGNNLQCPNVGAGTSEGCLQTESSSFETILGNEVMNIGAGGKLYHAAYFGADGHDFDIGWNSVHDVLGCRGMQWFNSSIDSYNINVHDNLLYNIRCDAINLASVNASSGYVNVYNNVVYHAGIGPDPGDLANYACININAAGNPSAAVQVFNNTMYDCGARGGSTAALMSPAVPAKLVDNIFYSISGEPYFEGGAQISGSNNLFYGNSSGPSSLTGNINSNPLFVSTSTPDFHLQSTSPAIDAGIATAASTDREGVIRPQGSAFDLGSYEYFKGSGSTPPPTTNACDLDGSGTVTQADVNLMLAQALGQAPCTADLDGNGKCDVVDVQRVINASLPNGTCRTGQ